MPCRALEVADVQTTSRRGFERIGGAKMHPSLAVTLCCCAIHETDRVQCVGAHCQYSDSSGAQCDGVQDGEIGYV